MPRSRRPAPSRNGTASASRSGHTARASICCAPILRSCSSCRSRTSPSSISRAPAATGTMRADDVALDAVLLAKAAGGRPVRVQWSRADEMTMRRSVQRWRSRSRPISTRTTISSAGAMRSGATATPRGRGARPAGAACGDRDRESLPAHDLDQSAAGQWRRRRPQLRFRSMIFRPGRSPATGC